LRSRVPGRAPAAVSDLAAELAALDAPEAPEGATASDRLYGAAAARGSAPVVDPEDQVVPAPEPPYEGSGPTPGEDWLYTAGGRRRSAKELVKARPAQMRAGRQPKVEASATPSRPAPLEPPDGDALPENAGLGGAQGAEPIRGVDATRPVDPVGDDGEAEWWSPTAPGEGAGPPRAPGADALLDDFLSDPDVMDKHLSRRPDLGTGRRRLLAAAPPAPPPPRRDPGLGEFARQLEFELREASSREGLDPGHGFGPPAPRALPPPRRRGSGPKSVRDILAALESLEE